MEERAPRRAERASPTSTAACCGGGRRHRSQETAGYAPLFKALGDETRLAIVGLLAAHRGALCVCDIEAGFDLSQPTVSHHLRILREAGVVEAERRGTWVHYWLARSVVERIREFHALLRPEHAKRRPAATGRETTR